MIVFLITNLSKDQLQIPRDRKVVRKMYTLPISLCHQPQWARVALLCPTARVKMGWVRWRVIRFLADIEELKDHVREEKEKGKRQAQEAVAPLKQKMAAMEEEMQELRDTCEGWEEAAVAAEEKAEAVTAESVGDKARLAKMDDEIGAVYEKYKRECKNRRKLHNLLAELKGNIRVFCRARCV